jgi:rhodanese-related sulfurtransferase
MKKLIYISILFFSISLSGQKNISELLHKHNTSSIYYISVNNLKANLKRFVILDAREPNEYKVSHLKNAIYVGYNNFDLNYTISNLKDKNTRIVVYCSLGIRSEDIAEKLQKVGYQNIYNLFGGIFEWKNKGNPVFDTQNNPTNKVHVFNKEWSKWLKKGEKVYE